MSPSNPSSRPSPTEVHKSIKQEFQLTLLEESEDLKEGNDLPGLQEILGETEETMSKFDASHDFKHCLRVLTLALLIQFEEPKRNPALRQIVEDESYSRRLTAYAALMHDLYDHKYSILPSPGNAKAPTHTKQFGDYLKGLSPDENAKFSDKLRWIITCVSWSFEQRNPHEVDNLCIRWPQLAFVRDADRLDAIGAVGIARAFAFGGARGRSPSETMQHFHDKLFKIQHCMKTTLGKELASDRTKRLAMFEDWLRDEQDTLLGSEVDKRAAPALARLGAAGIATLFSETGKRELGGTVQHMVKNLRELELDPVPWVSKECLALAKRRADRMREFIRWWNEETDGNTVTVNCIAPFRRIPEQR